MIDKPHLSVYMLMSSVPPWLLNFLDSEPYIIHAIETSLQTSTGAQQAPMVLVFIYSQTSAGMGMWWTSQKAKAVSSIRSSKIIFASSIFMFASCHVTHLTSIFSVCIKQQHVNGKCKTQCHEQGVTVVQGIDNAECGKTLCVFVHQTTSKCTTLHKTLWAKNAYTQKSCAHQILYVLHVAFAMLTQLAHGNHLLLNRFCYLYWGGRQAPQRPLLLQERRWMLLPCLQSSSDYPEDISDRLWSCQKQICSHYQAMMSLHDSLFAALVYRACIALQLGSVYNTSSRQLHAMTCQQCCTLLHHALDSIIITSCCDQCCLFYPPYEMSWTCLPCQANEMSMTSQDFRSMLSILHPQCPHWWFHSQHQRWVYDRCAAHRSG